MLLKRAKPGIVSKVREEALDEQGVVSKSSLMAKGREVAEQQDVVGYVGRQEGRPGIVKSPLVNCDLSKRGNTENRRSERATVHKELEGLKLNTRPGNPGEVSTTHV